MITTTSFVTIFEINYWSNGLLADALFRFVIGLVALLVGVVGVYRSWRTARGRSMSFAFIVGWAILWLTIHNFPMMLQRIRGLVEVYETGRCAVAEGTVSVKHEQPVHGHSSGDRIVVDDQVFEVNYFYATPAYRDTIARGGVLRSGVYVRLCHANGSILRVEVLRDLPKAKYPSRATPEIRLPRSHPGD